MVATRSKTRELRQIRPMPTRLTLSFDLVCQMASFLRNDKCTLLACTLVCKTWRDVVGKLVYHTITVRTEQVLESISESDSFSRWLTRLILRLPPLRTGWRYERYMHLRLKERSWMYQTANKLRRQASKIREVHIYSLGEGDDHESFFDMLTSGFPALQNLSLVECTLPPLALEGFLLNTVSLRGFHLELITWPRKRETLPNPQPSDLALTSLTTTASRHLFSFIESSASPQSLTHVYIHIPSLASYVATGDFLKCLGSSLRNLEFEYGNNYQSIFPPNFINQLQCISLQTLTGLQKVNFDSPDAPCIVHLLGELNSTELQEVKFCLHPKHMTRLRPKDYRWLDERLVEANLRHVEMIRFVYAGTLSNEAAKKIHRAFPLTHACGRMFVDASD